MAINFTNYFTWIGKAVHAANTADTASGTTVKDEFEDLVQVFTTQSIEIKATAEGFYDAVLGFISASSSLVSNVSPLAEELMIQMVEDDNPQPTNTIEDALAEFRQQMIDNSQSLDASSVGCTPSYDGGNTGDGVIVVSTKRPDGLVNELMHAEDIECVVSAADDDGEATIDFRGEEAEADITSYLWPAGSGVDSFITSTAADSGGNIVPNGDFDDADANESDLPDEWIGTTGTSTTQPTWGTTLKLSSVEVQTFQISGTPTGGWYTLSWTNGASDVQTTDTIAYNAGASTIQTELRALTGLESVTVTAAGGTPPNDTYTITFVDVTNPAQLTSTSALTGGTPVLTHATTTAATANAIGVRSVELDSDGAELVTLQVPLQDVIEESTQYAVDIMAKTDSVPAAGVITVELVDGIGGAVIADDQSTNNSYTIDCTALTTSWSHQTGVFRTPATLPDTVFLRIRTSTAISNTSSIFLDRAVMVEMEQTYVGGPYIAAFTGETNWAIDDKITLPVTNDEAGAFHRAIDRFIGLRTRDVLLPTNGAGAETIDDALIT